MTAKDSTQDQRTMATLRAIAQLGTMRVSVTSTTGIKGHYRRLLREGLVFSEDVTKEGVTYACYKLTAAGDRRLAKGA